MNIAEIAESKAVERDTFYHAYKANLAFSIELFLKCIEATSTERTILRVGDAQITRLFSGSNIRGHELDKIFGKLEQDRRKILSEKFESHPCNVTCSTLENILAELSDAFVKDRYAFEIGGITSSDPDTLLWTARFFKDALKP
ncbi:hypothetical protein [uncultured Porticoccus sp.]|uniref:hypothetical protein n=1 Tax=uncultured Porticoccus sp. TaxID=1256050 RepID=UPI00260C4B1D|nr:hypothetical protein [uncultured Porticoccus sp.]